MCNKGSMEMLIKASSIFGAPAESPVFICNERDAEIALLNELIEKHYGSGALMAFADLIEKEEEG